MSGACTPLITAYIFERIVIFVPHMDSAKFFWLSAYCGHAMAQQEPYSVPVSTRRFNSSGRKRRFQKLVELFCWGNTQHQNMNGSWQGNMCRTSFHNSQVSKLIFSRRAAVLVTLLHLSVNVVLSLKPRSQNAALMLKGRIQHIKHAR